MLKRIFDIIVSFIGIIIFLPVYLVIGLLIKADSRGPVFFKQERVGRYGKPFKILKFRSMKTSTNRKTITTSNDKRITKIGKIIRKYKLDELPELWNVLVGHMSIVGPRPDVPGYADKLTGEDKVILKMRPGITGPASLKYANEEYLLAQQPDPESYNDTIIFPDKVKINKDYYYNQNLFSDIKIIFMTIFRTYKD